MPRRNSCSELLSRETAGVEPSASFPQAPVRNAAERHENMHTKQDTAVPTIPLKACTAILHHVSVADERDHGARLTSVLYKSDELPRSGVDCDSTASRLRQCTCAEGKERDDTPGYGP